MTFFHLKVIFIILVGMLTGVFPVWGWAGEKSAVSSSLGGDRVLRLGFDATDVSSLDPHMAAGIQERPLADMMFNALVRFKPGRAPEMEPDLAESIPEPEMVDGRQVWTFKIKRGVRFHPGPDGQAHELTAEDVVRSLKKSADPARSAYAGEYKGLSFARLNDFSVQITLDRPMSPILLLPKLANYAGGFIVGPTMCDGLSPGEVPVGTGPFRFENRIVGDRILLRANDEYFRGRPRLDGVEMVFEPDSKKRDDLLQKGELDVSEHTGPQGKAWGPEIKVDVFGLGELVAIHMNTHHPILGDVRIRKAIAHALDRDRFLKNFDPEITRNTFAPIPAAGFFLGGLNYGEVKELGLDYPLDLDKARQLMAEAGFPHGFSLDLITSEMPVYLKNYECLRDQLAEIGIQCRLKVVDHATMHRQIRQGANPIVIYVAIRPNADVFLTGFFHSDSIVVDGIRPDTNFSRYDQIDALIEDARATVNPGMQIVLWKQAQIKLLSDLAVYPLHFKLLVYARRTEVDYGHDLINSMALYPQITERTSLGGPADPGGKDR